MLKNKIVEDLHEIRRQMLADAGGDARVLFERMRTLEKEFPDGRITLEQLSGGASAAGAEMARKR